MKELDFGNKIITGEGALAKLEELAGNSTLIITDQSMVKFGMVAKVKELLAHCEISEFDGVMPDPTLNVITAGVKALEECGAETIIALGGGSVMDTAKAVRMVGSKVLNRDISAWEFIAVPTTSGTGSEVTDYSVITDAEKGIKYPLTSKELRPSVAILDPALTISVPPTVTADTGMDALTHAIEAYISSNANDFSDALCEKAILYIYQYLPIAFKDGSNMTAREKLHIASCMAGLAFNSAGLGLNHGMAHAVGGKFHIAHGRINAMLLPYVMRFNADLEHAHNGEYSMPARKFQRIAHLLELPSSGTRLGANNLIRAIERMNHDLAIPSTLIELGKDPQEIERYRGEMVAAALADTTTQTNPRPVTQEQANEILTQLKGKRKN